MDQPRKDTEGNQILLDEILAIGTVLPKSYNQNYS